MSLHRHFVLLALALSLTTTGCSWFKRKKQPAPQPQAQAPTVAPQPAGPPPTTEPAKTPPAEEQKPAETAVAKPKPKPKPARPLKKVVVPPPKPEEEQQASAAPPPRVSISEGGANPASNSISPAMPHDQATDAKRTTQQLLDATDTNLRGLRRTLSADEKSIVEQIRSYQQQARTADQEGDVVRAHNLALKAHLLSDELVKR